MAGASEQNVTVAINHKDQYDADDMKVMLDVSDRMTEIGKKLPVEAVDAEAIGFYVFKGRWLPAIYCEMLLIR